jgi:hypothetical protein
LGTRVIKTFFLFNHFGGLIYYFPFKMERCVIQLIKFFTIVVVMALFVKGLQAIEAPEQITMNQFSKISITQKKANVFYDIYTPVLMPHEIHLLIDCEDCHHKWQAQIEPPLKCTAIGCHDILDRHSDQENIIKTASFAYHSRNSDKSCIGCHQTKKMAGEKAGPVACSECHMGD